MENISKLIKNPLTALLVFTFLLHFIIVIFVFLTGFQPFGNGSGDYVLYDKEARFVAETFKSGNIFLKDIPFVHSFSVVMGSLYFLITPSMLVGQIFNVFMVMLTGVTILFIVKESGGSDFQAFISGSLSAIYPSFIFFSSYMLKDPLVIFLAMISLFLGIKIIKNFSWRKFFIFYLALLALSNLRFYIGLAVVIAFIFCWVIFSGLEKKKRYFYALVMILLFGFIFQFSGYGYFGMDAVRHYLKPETITYYREGVYADSGSYVKMNTDIHHPTNFIFNYLWSMFLMIFGPLPWQMSGFKQLAILLEIIPWYFILFFSVEGVINKFKVDKPAVFLVLFSIIVLAVIGLYDSNYGLILRIRIPAFLALLCFLPFGLNLKNKHIKYINEKYEKIFS